MTAVFHSAPWLSGEIELPLSTVDRSILHLIRCRHFIVEKLPCKTLAATFAYLQGWYFVGEESRFPLA